MAEFLDVLGPLSERFHLVVPSLPGFGFSGPTRSRGWGPARIAHAWAELMRRLGYARYVAAGNDWGSTIAPELGRIAPDAVIGVHVTQLWTDTPDHLDDPAPDEGVDPDFVLTNVSIHWLTGTVASAMRLYREDALHPTPAEPTTVALAAAQFADDYQPFRRLVAGRHADVVAWNVYDRPGHFAAHQSPELLIADLSEFVRLLN
jgi:epoxide hydrolase